MPLPLLGNRPLQIRQLVLEGLEQALHAGLHGPGGSGPYPQLLVPLALAAQPVGDFLAPPQHRVQLAHLAGERLPDRQRGLGAKAREEQRLLPVGFGPQALAARPRPSGVRPMDLPAGLTPRPQRKRQLVAPRRLPHERDRLAVGVLWPLLPAETAGEPCSPTTASRKATQPSPVCANVPH